MIRSSFLIFLRLTVVLLTLQLSHAQDCIVPPTLDLSVAKILCDQPYFYNFVPRTEENELLDNICLTFYPLPDDPNMYTVYISYVYCDGSTAVMTYVGAQTAKGTFVAANPMGTSTFYIFGYAGCDTYVGVTCPLYGVTTSSLVFGTIYGFSTNCSPIGLSCLRKVEEIINNACLPQEDFYVLPMKLPNRCVTQQLCTIPPNPFYNRLGPSVGLL